MGFMLLHMIVHRVLILFDYLALRTDKAPFRILLIRVDWHCSGEGMGGLDQFYQRFAQ
jgi:hypothetical protein